MREAGNSTSRANAEAARAIRRARAERRAALEDVITLAIAELDAMDWDCDLEPDYEGEEEPDEATAQPMTLAPDWVRPVVVPRPARLGGARA